MVFLVAEHDGCAAMRRYVLMLVGLLSSCLDFSSFATADAQTGDDDNDQEQGLFHRIDHG